MFINFNLMARRRDGHDAFPGVCREKTAVHRRSKAYIYLNRTKKTFRTNRSIIFLKLYRYDRDSRALRTKASMRRCDIREDIREKRLRRLRYFHESASPNET